MIKQIMLTADFNLFFNRRYDIINSLSFSDNTANLNNHDTHFNFIAQQLLVSYYHFKYKLFGQTAVIYVIICDHKYNMNINSLLIIHSFIRLDQWYFQASILKHFKRKSLRYFFTYFYRNDITLIEILFIAEFKVKNW